MFTVDVKQQYNNNITKIMQQEQQQLFFLPLSGRWPTSLDDSMAMMYCAEYCLKGPFSLKQPTNQSVIIEARTVQRKIVHYHIRMTSWNWGGGMGGGVGWLFWV